MRPPDLDASGILDDPTLRLHLIAMLDQVLWLSQWSAQVKVINAAEHQELDQHLAILDEVLRTVLAQQLLPASPPSSLAKP